MTPALTRTGPIDVAATAASISLHTARGESESFQVIVRAPAGGLSNVDVSVSDLVGPNGAVIASTRLALFREHYALVTSSSLDLGGSNRPLPKGFYPDALIPFVDPATGRRLSGATFTAAPFSVQEGHNQPIWIDVAVPRTSVAGTYTGTVTVTSAGGSAQIGIQMTVWAFSLPIAPALKSSFGFHGANQSSRLNAALLLEHRLMPFQVDPSVPGDLPASGLNAIGLPFWSTADPVAGTISAPPSVSALRAAAQTWPAGVETYEYAADEIDGYVPRINDSLKAWSRNVHAAGSKMLVTVMPDPSLYDDGSGSGRSAVDIWVMLPKQAVAAAAHTAEVLAKGDEVWSYNCLVQDPSSPKWELDFAPVNYRIQPGFLNQRFAFSGLLYYSVDLWGRDPWNVPNQVVDGQFNYPGEGMLVYPGSLVGLTQVVPSMRLKWLRDGVDDFDYIAMLKARGQGDWAMQLVSSVASDWSNWSKDPQAVEAVRVQLGQRLDSLARAATPANPWPSDRETGLDSALNLQWSTVSNATRYDIFIGTDSAALSLYSSVSPTSPTAATMSAPVYNLHASTTYYWKVVAFIGSIPSSGPTWSFATKATPDTKPPVISAVSASRITARSATIIWTTSESADSHVQYGTTSAYGVSSILDTALVTSHSVTLNGLSRKTFYHYRVMSRDAAGNLATSIDGVGVIGRSIDATPRDTSAGDFTFTTADEDLGGKNGCGFGAGIALLGLASIFACLRPSRSWHFR
ncbi:MAG: DUF4091 domain-containing protein [Planctomycetes bacterium]|nr:DUF4091 domain-containing protein [Planctomycetota bacterium]